MIALNPYIPIAPTNLGYGRWLILVECRGRRPRWLGNLAIISGRATPAIHADPCSY